MSVWPTCAVAIVILIEYDWTRGREGAGRHP